MNFTKSSFIVRHDDPEFADIVGTDRPDFPERDQRSPQIELPELADSSLTHRALRLLDAALVGCDNESTSAILRAVTLLMVTCPLVREAVEMAPFYVERLFPALPRNLQMAAAEDSMARLRSNS